MSELHENLAPFQDKTPKDLLRWAFTRKPQPWPKAVGNAPQPLAAARVEGPALRAVWVGHATVLIQHLGLNILIDPHWGPRCSPVSWAGPKRVAEPGLRFEDLPPLDAVLITHNHYDHFDVDTVRRLALSQPKARFIVALGDGALAKGCGVAEPLELAWWQCLEIGGLRIHFTPTQHFSARSLWDRRKSQWGGFVLESPHGNIYHAGDTAWGPHFEATRERFGGFRAAFLPIGAYEPRWFMHTVHVNPEEAVRAHLALNAQRSVGVHWGTFAGLTDEAWDEPAKALAAALTAQKVPADSFFVPDFGKAMEL